MWDNLSIKEKNDIMKIAIQNGITDLNDIKAKYNEFKFGGSTNDEFPDDPPKGLGFIKRYAPNLYDVYMQDRARTEATTRKMLAEGSRRRKEQERIGMVPAPTASNNTYSRDAIRTNRDNYSSNETYYAATRGSTHQRNVQRERESQQVGRMRPAVISAPGTKLSEEYMYNLEKGLPTEGLSLTGDGGNRDSFYGSLNAYDNFVRRQAEFENNAEKSAWYQPESIRNTLGYVNPVYAATNLFINPDKESLSKRATKVATSFLPGVAGRMANANKASRLANPIAANNAAMQAPTTGQFLKNFGINMVKDMPLFLAGEYATNKLVQATTPYESWAQGVSDVTGLPETITSLTNPGGIFAPAGFQQLAGSMAKADMEGFANKIINNSKALYGNAKETAGRFFDDIGDNIDGLLGVPSQRPLFVTPNGTTVRADLGSFRGNNRMNMIGSSKAGSGASQPAIPQGQRSAAPSTSKPPVKVLPVESLKSLQSVENLINKFSSQREALSTMYDVDETLAALNARKQQLLGATQGEGGVGSASLFNPTVNTPINDFWNPVANGEQGALEALYNRMAQDYRVDRSVIDKWVKEKYPFLSTQSDREGLMRALGMNKNNNSWNRLAMDLKLSDAIGDYKASTLAKDKDFQQRLKQIYDALGVTAEKYKPSEIARNYHTFFKVGMSDDEVIKRILKRNHFNTINNVHEAAKNAMMKTGKANWTKNMIDYLPDDALGIMSDYNIDMDQLFKLGQVAIDNSSEKVGYNSLRKALNQTPYVTRTTLPKALELKQKLLGYDKEKGFLYDNAPIDRETVNTYLSLFGERDHPDFYDQTTEGQVRKEILSRMKKNSKPERQLTLFEAADNDFSADSSPMIFSMSSALSNFRNKLGLFPGMITPNGARIVEGNEFANVNLGTYENPYTGRRFIEDGKPERIPTREEIRGYKSREDALADINLGLAKMYKTVMNNSKGYAGLPSYNFDESVLDKVIENKGYLKTLDAQGNRTVDIPGVNGFFDDGVTPWWATYNGKAPEYPGIDIYFGKGGYLNANKFKDGGPRKPIRRGVPLGIPGAAFMLERILNSVDKPVPSKNISREHIEAPSSTYVSRFNPSFILKGFDRLSSDELQAIHRDNPNIDLSTMANPAIVRPNKKRMENIKKMFPNARLRSNAYRTVEERNGRIRNNFDSDAEVFDRLYNLYQFANNPKVNYGKGRANTDIYTTPLGNLLGYNDSAVLNKIYDFDSYMAEMAHALQYKDKNLKKYNLFMSPSRDNDIEDRYGVGDDAYKNAYWTPNQHDRNNYINPYHMEGQAHSIIEPATYDYAFLGGPSYYNYLPKYQKTMNNTALYNLTNQGQDLLHRFGLNDEEVEEVLPYPDQFYDEDFILTAGPHSKRGELYKNGGFLLSP